MSKCHECTFFTPLIRICRRVQKYKIKDLGFQVRNRHKIWWMAGYTIAGRAISGGMFFLPGQSV